MTAAIDLNFFQFFFIHSCLSLSFWYVGCQYHQHNYDFLENIPIIKFEFLSC